MKIRVAAPENFIGNEDENLVVSRFETSIPLFPKTKRTISAFYELDEPGNYMFSLILKEPKLNPDLPVDQKTLQVRERIYEQYKDHPGYIKRNEIYLNIHKYHCLT